MPFSLNGPAPHAEHTNVLTAALWFGSSGLPLWFKWGVSLGTRCAVILRFVSLVDLSGSATAVGTMSGFAVGLPAAKVHHLLMCIRMPLVLKGPLSHALQ